MEIWHKSTRLRKSFHQAYQVFTSKQEFSNPTVIMIFHALTVTDEKKLFSEVKSVKPLKNKRTKMHQTSPWIKEVLMVSSLPFLYFRSRPSVWTTKGKEHRHAAFAKSAVRCLLEKQRPLRKYCKFVFAATETLGNPSTFCLSFCKESISSVGGLGMQLEMRREVS